MKKYLVYLLIVFMVISMGLISTLFIQRPINININGNTDLSIEKINSWIDNLSVRKDILTDIILEKKILEKCGDNESRDAYLFQLVNKYGDKIKVSGYLEGEELLVCKTYGTAP